jgi:hypothetical protein
VPVKTTYYSDSEMDRLEQIVEESDKSFSEAVRVAIQEYYDL